MNNKLSTIAPLIAYTLGLPKAEDFYISDYERSALPILVSDLTGLSISHVIPKFVMGRVISVDVYPVNIADPILVYSPIGNLKPYYKIWSTVMRNGMGMFGGWKLKKYNEAINIFVESSIGLLSKDEIGFAIVEMLKFKNSVMLNNNFQFWSS